MNKKTLGWILKAPLLIVFSLSVIAGFYVYFSKMAELSLASPIILLIFLSLFAAGEYYLNKYHANNRGGGKT